MNAPKAPSGPGLTPEQILAELSVVRHTQPIEALAAADFHREALISPLLQGIVRGLEDPTGLSENNAMLFSYAMYLLAKWREPRTYPLIVRRLSLPGEDAFEIGGDTVTEEGGRFLASMCGGSGFKAIRAEDDPETAETRSRGGRKATRGTR